MTAIVLYGPPTAGKDTISSSLSAADSRFQLVTKLKQGTGRTTGYRFVTPQELDELRAQDRIVVETHRYGNVYAVDRQDIERMRSEGVVPVVHIGNVTDLRALLRGAPGDWMRVLLWISREACEDRSRLRGDVDTPDRLKAWDETEADLLASDVQGLFDLVLRTDGMDVGAAVEAITAGLETPRTPCTPEELRAHVIRRAER